MKLVLDGKEICDCAMSANAIVTENYVNALGDYYTAHDIVIKDEDTQKYHWESAIPIMNNSINNKYYIVFRERAKDEVIDKLDDFLKNNQSDVSGMFPEWKAGTSYETEKYVTYDGAIYKVIQAHTSQSDWTPDKTSALFLRIDGRSNDTDYPDWVQPNGAIGVYAKNDKVTYDDKKWVSTIDNNVWAPGVYGWTLAGEKNASDSTGSDDQKKDAETITEWVQPTGATDAYAKGSKVTHNGKTWTSTADANVWEPGVYGWSEIATE